MHDEPLNQPAQPSPSGGDVAPRPPDHDKVQKHDSADSADSAFESERSENVEADSSQPSVAGVSTERVSAAALPAEAQSVKPMPSEGAARGPLDVAAVADDQLHPLDPRFVPVERISGLITMTILCVPSFFVLLVASFFGWPSRWWIVAGWSGWLVITAWLLWLTLHFTVLSFRHTHYRVNDIGIEIRKGVLWRSIATVPRSRIQHTDVGQGPIQRRFGISKLTVYTAGTVHSSVELSGLEYQRALLIRDYLISSEESDGV